MLFGYALFTKASILPNFLFKVLIKFSIEFFDEISKFKNKIFDKNIPLFNISNRKVIISDDLFKLLDYKFVMFEGTYTLLDKLKERIDFIILIISPKIRKGNNALNEIDMDFEVMHENFIGEDKIVFLKRR